MTGADLGRRLREGDRSAAPAVLNLVETRSDAVRDELAGLLREVSPAALDGEAGGHVVGVTGPPGAGKSTLLSELVRAWRAAGRTVAVLAVDPSSRRSGGSLLGDRARIAFDPADDGVFIRSTAAGGRMGGLAPATRAAAQALAAAFDVVVVETVGVGQSETDVAEVADTVAVVVQPGSGDVLQFLKAGIMEIPDVLVVTKTDLGEVALRARRDLNAALRSRRQARRARGRGHRDRAGRRRGRARGRDRRAPRDGSICPRAASPPAARARWPTSRPSTASAGCGRSVGGGRPAACCAAQPAGADVPALVAALEAEAGVR